jgi:hypothetical protein
VGLDFSGPSELLSRLIYSRGTYVVLVLSAIVAAAVAVYGEVVRWRREARKREAIDYIAVYIRAMNLLRSVALNIWTSEDSERAHLLIIDSIREVEEHIDRSLGKSLRQAIGLPATGHIWVADTSRATTLDSAPSGAAVLRWRVGVLHSYLDMYRTGGLL